MNVLFVIIIKMYYPKVWNQFYLNFSPNFIISKTIESLTSKNLLYKMNMNLRFFWISLFNDIITKAAWTQDCTEVFTWSLSQIYWTSDLKMIEYVYYKYKSRIINIFH